MNNLGLLYSDQGKPKKAEEMYQAAEFPDSQEAKHPNTKKGRAIEEIRRWLK